MSGFIFRRVAQALIVVIGVSVVVFFLARLAPGDPVSLMLAETASPEQIEAAREHYGFNEPLWYQYGLFASRALQGDFGDSLYYKQPALGVVLDAFPATAKLAAVSFAIAVLVAVPLGVIAAIKRDTVWDYVAIGLSVIGQAAPSYWIGILLILFFSVRFHWFPSSGNYGPSYIVLPAITLAAVLMAVLTRLTRAGMLDVLSEDYVRTARSKGLRESGVIVRHALRNALIPLVTVMGLQLGSILGGTIIVEQVFAWPGVGRLAVNAISSRDYPIIQAVVLLVSIVFVVINLLVDLLYGFLDPRIRHS
ncbi:MAG: nickel ABC transporter permease [Thermomicrobiales bacterium]